MQKVNEKGVKYNLSFSLEKGEKIKINIKGKCEVSFGFRVLTNNNEGKKTSEYFYTEK